MDRKHDLVLDATDHIGVRSLIQQISLETGIGWIHSGAIADRWVAASFAPPGSPCYHCWVSPEASKADLGTCENRGRTPRELHGRLRCCHEITDGIDQIFFHGIRQ